MYKKGEKNHLNNYRPIFILPTISKVFEHLIFGQIYNYFNTNSLLCEQQYGFRSGHSTEFVTIKLVDHIIQNMDNTRITKTPVTVFLDLSKAFDNLNFDILLHKTTILWCKWCSTIIDQKLFKLKISIYQIIMIILILRVWRLKLVFLKDLF